jgi:hypothetical protein
VVIDLSKPKPISDLIVLIGMSQPEVAAYLAAHDIKTSEGAVKAWSRGIYDPPREAIHLLWSLWLVVQNGGQLPEHTPPSVGKRQAAISSLRVLVSK